MIAVHRTGTTLSAREVLAQIKNCWEQDDLDHLDRLILDLTTWDQFELYRPDSSDWQTIYRIKDWRPEDWAIMDEFLGDVYEITRMDDGVVGAV